MKKADEISPEEIRRQALASPLVWFAVYCWILDKQRQKVRPIPNIAQIRFAEAVEYCIANNLPCRIIMVKPRKVGISTFCVAVAYWLMRKRKLFAAILADIIPRTGVLANMMEFIAKNDTFKWDDGNEPIFANNEMRLGNAPDASHSQNFTANNPNSAIGETPQVLVATEAAHYPKGGVLDGTKTMTNTLNSIAKLPWTFVFTESTAAGREGFFPDMWDNAHWPTFYEPQDRYWLRYKDGKHEGDGGFIRVFVAWWEMEEYRLEVNQLQREHIQQTLTADEKIGIQSYGWTAEQLAWRRDTIKNECLGKENNFKRDFPSSPDEPFNFSGSPRFDINGMLYMNSVKNMVQGAYGVITEPELHPVTKERMTQSVSFRPAEVSQAWFRMWEQPKPGCRYIVGTDIAEDKDVNPASSDDNEVRRDRHSGFVERAGYRDDRGVIWRPRIVGRIVAPCRDGHDLYAKKLLLISLLYGGCPIVGERNNHGISVLKLLRQLNANVLFSTIMNEATGKPVERYWHLTDKTNRGPMIENLDKSFRSIAPVTNELGETYLDPEALQIYCERALEECGNFVVDKKGHAAASANNHDDDVMGIALTHYYIGSAKVYSDKTVERGPASWDYKVVRDQVEKRSILGV